MTSFNSENSLLLIKQEKIRLYISTITYKCYTIYAYASFSIAFVKKSIAKRLGLSYHQCHLIFNEKVLENWCSLSYYGIVDESNLEFYFNMHTGPYISNNPQEDRLYLELQDIFINQKQMYEINEPGKKDIRTYLACMGDHFNIYRFILKANGVECCEKEIFKLPSTRKNDKSPSKDSEKLYQRKIQNKITKTKVNILKQLMSSRKSQIIKRNVYIKTPSYLIYERKYHLKRRNETPDKTKKVLGSILRKRNYSFCKKSRKKRRFYNNVELNIKIPQDPISYSSHGSNLIIPCINHDLEQDRMKKEAASIFSEENKSNLIESNNILNVHQKSDGKYRASFDELYININKNSNILDDDKKRMRQEASFLFQKEANIFVEEPNIITKQPNPHLAKQYLPSLKLKHKRCAFCNKKLNITNIYLCRCNKEFCNSHRLAEAHQCTFDYRNHGRKMIEKENPLVMAPKINKI